MCVCVCVCVCGRSGWMNAAASYIGNGPHVYVRSAGDKTVESLGVRVRVRVWLRAGEMEQSFSTWREAVGHDGNGEAAAQSHERGGEADHAGADHADMRPSCRHWRLT